MTNRDPRQRRLSGFDDDGPENGERVSGPADAAGAPSAGGHRLCLDGKSVYVLDAHSLIYQVFHALQHMSGPKGQPVNAIFGFLRDIVDILQRRKPDYLICAFDPPGKTFRHEIYAQYKADRPPMPVDLQPQISNIQRFLVALAIPVASVPRYEADDVLATVACQVERLGGACFLVTSDKDCRQLITDRVKILNLRKNEVVDASAVAEQWGIRPDQAVDLQAMWGDSTDNIPGIPGIGRKTAAQLLSQYGTLEGVFEHVSEISGAKRRERIVEGRETALMSRRLVRLATDVPLELDWESARVGGMDRQAVLDLCAEFGFQRLTERLTGLPVTSAPATWDARYETIASEPSLRDLVATLAGQRRFAVDTETTSTRASQADIVGYSFSWEAGHAVYLPVRAPAADAHLDGALVAASLRAILEDPKIEKIGQNLKYDMVVLRRAGIRMRGIAFDTMVADYLLVPGERNHGLDDLAKRYLNHETVKISALIGTGKSQKRMDQVPVAAVTPYAAEDADVPLRLATILADRLREEGLDELFHSLEMPLIEVLAEMESNGISIDVRRLEQLSAEYAQRLQELECEIHDLAGRPFNINSPKQLAHVLFQELGLPILKKRKTGPSTDASVLSELADQHPLPAKLIEYRQCAKLKSTYIDALPELACRETGRVHTSFKQDVAATGRLSSTDPNLQNIPVRTSDGREIRAAFVAPGPGWLLMCADYSQIELRVLAHCSQDEALLRAFAEDRDIHAQVASEVYGVGIADVTADMRRSAKAINFGIIYGQSPFGLAKALSIDKSEAATFIDAYFDRYPGVERFMADILAECREKGYVSTILGRRRAIAFEGTRDVSLREGSRQRSLPERIAINTVIQGSAADLIKQAMIRVHGRMQRERFQARLLLQIHDELVFESPEKELAALSRLVTEEMAAAGDLSVPLKIDVKAGVNWASCERIS